MSAHDRGSGRTRLRIAAGFVVGEALGDGHGLAIVQHLGVARVAGGAVDVGLAMVQRGQPVELVVLEAAGVGVARSIRLVGQVGGHGV